MILMAGGPKRRETAQVGRLIVGAAAVNWLTFLSRAGGGGTGIRSLGSHS